MLKKSSFVLGIQVLAQVIMFVTYKNLTTDYDGIVVERFYQITTLSVYLSGFIGLKLDVAHLQPKIGSWRGDMLLAISVVTATLLCLILSIWSIEIGILTLVTFLNNAFALSNIRESKYKRFGLAKLTQVLLFAYLIEGQLVNPVWSFILANFVSSLLLFNINPRFRFKGMRKIIVLVYSYKDYLKYSLMSAVLLNLYLNVFGIFIPFYGDADLSVQIFKIEKFFIAPLLLVSNSISSVFRSEAQLLVNRLENIDVLKRKLLKILSLLVVIYLISIYSGFLGSIYKVIGLNIPDISTVFILMILFGSLRFFSMPWMSLFYIKNRLKEDLKVSILLVLSAMTSILIASVSTLEIALITFVVLLLFIYGFVFYNLFYDSRYS